MESGGKLRSDGALAVAAQQGNPGVQRKQTQMKKLMIVAALVCAAAMSHAASMDWKVVTGSGTAGLNIYICKSIAEFENEAQIESYLYGTSGNSATAASKSHGAWYGNSSTAGGIDASEVGTGKTFYAVVVDKSGNGYYTMAGTAEVYNTNPTPVQGELDMSAMISGGSYTAWKTGPGPDPTPEPTTGLLMLVGLAGLALKRKVA